MNTIHVTAEIDVSDALGELSNDDLLEELSSRGLMDSKQIALSFNEWEIIEMICSKKSITEADSIMQFFKKTNNK